VRAREALRRWYEPRRRRYPWRVRVTPYRVLVSEVMLQQTQAARVVPAFRAFVRRFPSVRALAAAPLADVLRAWAGLGYNRRAVALAKAARAIVRDHRGWVPDDPAALQRLPGVGPYTAAAVVSLGYGRPIPALDVNVTRVVSRARLGVDRAPAREVERAAARWLDRDDPGAWNQAVMDLGREVCRPLPRCHVCPLASGCRFRRAGGAPAPVGRTQGRFEGSFRQLRGGVVAAVRELPVATLAGLSRRLGHPAPRVAVAVRALAAEGLLRAGPAALAGDPKGRVRLPT
jgi:A/G-specific adenine glycosylase